MAITAEQLVQLKIGAQWADSLNETFERFNIATPIQQAAFIGQCGHESANFTRLEEGLSYSAERLMKVWPRRFPTLESAQPYARNPKALANNVYANRMGNRDEASGDGHRFRGRGLIQLTGHAGYFHAGKALGVDLVKEPNLVLTPQYAALTAGWFWGTHDCSRFAQAMDWKGLTRKINGGTHGLEDRVLRTNAALALLRG